MRGVAAGVLVALWAGTAFAGDKLELGPAPSWVRVDPAPQPPTAPGTADAQLLFSDHQDRFSADGQESYVRNLFLIRTPQGLASLGNVAVVWNPDTDTMTVNGLHIIRAGKVIDVLADQSFTVLRRETSLELAVLNGQLTAAIQPAGLEAGDIIDFAFTLRRKDPTFQGRSEFLSTFNLPVPIERLRVRELWTASKPIRWRATRGLDAPKLTRSADGQELLVDMKSAQPIKPPNLAPPRFAQLRQLEVSEFASWSEVAALTAPLFATASTLKPDSPLKAEAARIAAASSDPAVRAAMALRLVQDKVRYVFLGMNLGGYVPAAADLTWSRRFGDCKGKTALLIALLRELGVEAEPALVSSTGGDGLDARLPMLEVFDHVIVRAVIGGKVYWLDGTRQGDRALDEIAIPNFHWALPVRQTGSRLERLAPAPLLQPNIETVIRLDASAGMDAPAPAHIEVVYRDDLATAMRQAIANLAPADLDRFNREVWKKAYSWIDVDKAQAVYDPDRGEERLVMDGKARMEWSKAADQRRQYTLDGANLGWKADFDREPGPDADAPYAVDYPSFARTTETIVLPVAGVGFELAGGNLDTTVAGLQLRRTMQIDKNLLTMTASSRALAPEFPASEAPAAAKALKALWDVDVVVKGPAPGKQANLKSTAEQVIGVAPTTAAGFAVRAEAYDIKGDYDHAMADYDEAIKRDPKNPAFYAGRATIHMRRNQPDLAMQDVDKALALDPAQPAALRVKGFALGEQKRYAEAVRAFDASLASAPGDAFAWYGRGRAHHELGEDDAALTDLAEALRIRPDLDEAYDTRAGIYDARGQSDKALADLDQILAHKPHDAQALAGKADFLSRHGRKPQAVKLYTESLAAEPYAPVYLARAQARAPEDRAAAFADIDAALKLDPRSSDAHQVRAQLLARAKDYAGAVREFDEAAKLAPDDGAIVVRRDQMLITAGRGAEVRADVARLTATRPHWAGELLNTLCWTTATTGGDAKAALADCDASLKLLPDHGPTLDSRGFAHLKLGQFDQAIADYDASLKIRPSLAASLYGRGVARLRLGRTQDGQADLAAARAIDPKVDEEFAGYGVKP